MTKRNQIHSVFNGKPVTSLFRTLLRGLLLMRHPGKEFNLLSHGTHLVPRERRYVIYHSLKKYSDIV